MYQYVLFDLDGTLTDPKEGICKSVQYALHAKNIEEPDLDKLEPFIGPPLMTGFKEFYGMDEENAKEAVQKFRERFERVGLYENILYPGMKQLLLALCEKGVHLAVASSKPQEFVEKILEHFKIRQYFEVVVGSEKDGRRAEKNQVIREALQRLFHTEISDALLKDGGIPLQSILMVGDRKFDILAAKEFHIKSVGVTYGYAKEGELEEAGADALAEDLEQLYRIITGKVWKKSAANVSALHKSLDIVMPVVYEYAITFVVLFILMTGYRILATRGDGSDMEALFYNKEQQTGIAVYLEGIATLACLFVFAKLYQREKPCPLSAKQQRLKSERIWRAALPLIGLAACMAIFLNICFYYLKLFSVSLSYEERAALQYSVPLIYGLFYYGLVKPVQEELVYRGLVYGRMRKYFSGRVAIVASAFVFGAIHGNLVQLLYGFLMGMLLAWSFEHFGSLKASVLVHSAANIVVYLVSSIPSVKKSVFSLAGAAVSGMLIVVFSLGLYARRNKTCRRIGSRE